MGRDDLTNRESDNGLRIRMFAKASITAKQNVYRCILKSQKLSAQLLEKTVQRESKKPRRPF